MRKIGTKQSRLDMCRWNQGPRSELRGKEQQCVLATGKKKEQPLSTLELPEGIWLTF